MGGTKINHHLQVLDQDDTLIPGLYAVGVDTGGWETGTYNTCLLGRTLVLRLTPAGLQGKTRPPIA